MKFLAKMNRGLFLIILLLVNVISAQKITILDSETQEPVINAVLYNNDKSKTVLTDFDGISDLSVFNMEERITIRHISYQTKRSTKELLTRRGGKVYLTLKREQLDEVVMSISKWEQQKKDIPQKIVSINTQSIAFTNPQTSADLLQNSGQIFVQKSQLGGGSPIIRGFSTNRLLLSVDGVRMNNAIFRGGNIQNIISIDPFTVKNTEVVFGPGSVIYGSDAIGGVMNFITNEAQFSATDSLHISGNLNYRYASGNDENTGHFKINLGTSKWAFLTSATYNNFNDLKMGRHGPDSYLRNEYVKRLNGNDVLVENEDPRLQKPTEYDQINLMQKITHKPNNNWRYDLGLFYSSTSDYSRYDRLIRPNSDGTGLQSAEWFYGPQKWFMGNIQIYKNGSGKFYDGLKITTAYQNFKESRNERQFQDSIRYTTKENIDALSVNVDFENKKIGNLRMYYGAEYIFNNVGSKGIQTNIESGLVQNAQSRYPDGSTWQTLAAYVNAELKSKPNFTWLGGIRYSHVWINADFDTTFYSFPVDNADLNNGALTGSVGFSWFPKADFQVTLNGSTGFRAPNIDDIGKVFDSEPGSVVVPNPFLKPEYAYNAEIGLHKNFKDKVVLKGAAYYTYLVDALVRRDYQFNGEEEIIYNGELSNVQAIQNASSAYVYGLEFGLEAFLSDNFSILSNLTLTNGTEEDENGDDTPVRHVPPSFADFHLIWRNQKLKTDLFLNYNGEISYNNLAISERNKSYIYAKDANGNPYSPSWYTLNLRSQYQISNPLRLTFTIENITNQRYRPYSSGIAATGINFVLGLSFRF
ncbi:TonB-dependent receptor [uncultured Eudoraea sp.]|uniref:TonB-dependent receptor n=1 Tax=uncultured Eudoraea sp. TaxID=1035614 RepID=UPI002615CD94|nr:TonB-dependent receptor [uncultured Eudoraea sp.]